MVEILNLVLFLGSKSEENSDKGVPNIFHYSLLAHVRGMRIPVVGSIPTAHSFFGICILLVFSYQIFFFHFLLELHKYLDIIAPAFLCI